MRTHSLLRKNSLTLQAETEFLVQDDMALFVFLQGVARPFSSKRLNGPLCSYLLMDPSELCVIGLKKIWGQNYT